MPEKSAPSLGDPDLHGGPSASSSTSSSFAPPSPLSNTDYRHARFPSRITRVTPRGTNPVDLSPTASQSAPRIVVVGVCSAGKSTLVRALRERGYNARAVSQEHSYVPHLWQRSTPDVLVYLDASLHTIRGRGRRRWSQSLLDEEHHRLEHAREHSDLYITTNGLSQQDVVSRVLTFLSKRVTSDE